MLTAMIVLALVGLLAFANGSNDNCKGVATLVGFGAATPRRALLWATLTTAVGSGVSFWLAGGLVKSFSTGLFTASAPMGAGLFAAVLVGAIGWILFATLTGLPVSTTHAITGGLVGAGLVAFSAGQVQWAELLRKFALPLALSPILSLAAVYVVSGPVVYLAKRYGGRCVCVVPDAAVGDCAMAATATATPVVRVVADTEANCATQSPAVAVTTSAAANATHWASSGLVGFARGWNDAPKVAALAVGTLAVAGVPNGTALAFAVVTVAMAAGGLLAGRRVLETMARKLTPMPLAESLTASMTTAALVCAASWAAMPVSTTHVSTGAIVGAGVRNDPRKVKWGKVGEIVLSWLVTLPVAALLAAAAMVLMRYLPTR
jgi:PiT family inorganic phosphate transporter